MKANWETIKSLMTIHADDRDMISLIVDGLESFERYHQAIYALEIQRKLYACGAMDSETYRDVIPHLDQVRTSAHNAVIMNVQILNRIAAQSNLEPFYDGVVSEERPYRTLLADAILEFVREIIDNRVKGK